MVLIRYGGMFIKTRRFYHYISPFDIRWEFFAPVPFARTSGVCSRCDDHMHALFFDYDHKLRSYVSRDLEIMANAWNYPVGYDTGLLTFGRTYLFQTARTNFMAICPDKFSLSLANLVLHHSGCDFAFKSAARYISETGTWVLRTAEKGDRGKPVYVGFVDSSFTKHRRLYSHGSMKSLFHMMYMVKHMGVPPKDVIWYPNDGCRTGTIVSYNTSSRISMGDEEERSQE